jgi:hypothetical protein
VVRKIPPSQPWRPNAGDFVPRIRPGGQEGLEIFPEPALAAKRGWRFAPSGLSRPGSLSEAEAEDASVSLDLFIRSLLTMGLETATSRT